MAGKTQLRKEDMGRAAPDNALAYVDNYDQMAPRLHPRARGAVEPYVDMMERSQAMRGARTLGPPGEGVDAMSDMEDAAEQMGKMPEGRSQEDLEQILALAAKSPEMSTDAGLMMLERVAKTYGLRTPFGGDPYAKGNEVTMDRRVPSMQPGGEDEDMPYRVNPRSRVPYRR